MSVVYLLLAFVSTDPRNTEITVAAHYATRQQCSDRAIDLHSMTQKNPFRRERFACAEWRLQ
jgi:hypothetical protein